MSSTNRQHTLVIHTKEDGTELVVLEKDWYSYEWCALFPRRMIVESKAGRFHLVGERFVFSPAEAQRLVDRVLAGKTQTIDLRELSVKHYPTAEEKRRRK